MHILLVQRHVPRNELFAVAHAFEHPRRLLVDDRIDAIPRPAFRQRRACMAVAQIHPLLGNLQRERQCAPLDCQRIVLRQIVHAGHARLHLQHDVDGVAVRPCAVQARTFHAVHADAVFFAPIRLFEEDFKCLRLFRMDHVMDCISKWIQRLALDDDAMMADGIRAVGVDMQIARIVRHGGEMDEFRQRSDGCHRAAGDGMDGREQMMHGIEMR